MVEHFSFPSTVTLVMHIFKNIGFSFKKIIDGCIHLLKRFDTVQARVAFYVKCTELKTIMMKNQFLWMKVGFLNIILPISSGTIP